MPWPIGSRTAMLIRLRWNQRGLLDTLIWIVGVARLHCVFGQCAHVKNVSGRKSDVLDTNVAATDELRPSPWRVSPADEVCVLRALTDNARRCCAVRRGRYSTCKKRSHRWTSARQRHLLCGGRERRGSWRAIVAGERDGNVLAAMKGVRIHAAMMRLSKACKATGVASTCLHSNRRWRYSTLSAPNWQNVTERLSGSCSACKRMKGNREKVRKKASPAMRLSLICTPTIQNVRCWYHSHWCINVTTALAVVSEVGADMSRFPSDKHFASWLGCARTKITGGKVMSGKTSAVPTVLPSIAARRLSENRDCSEESHLSQIFGHLKRIVVLYKRNMAEMAFFRSRFSILGQPPKVVLFSA